MSTDRRRRRNGSRRYSFEVRRDLRPRTYQGWKLVATWYKRSKSSQEAGPRPDDVLPSEPSRLPRQALSPFPAGPTPSGSVKGIWGGPRLPASAQQLSTRSQRRARFPTRRFHLTLINPAGFDKKLFRRLSADGR